MEIAEHFSAEAQNFYNETPSLKHPYSRTLRYFVYDK